MKNLLFLATGLLMIGCAESPSTEVSDVVESDAVEQTEVVVEANVYPYAAGEEFDQSMALSSDEMNQVVTEFDGTRKTVSFASEITENCEKKGCWMMVNAGGEQIRVSFRDYDFFVPLDSKGHQTVLNGELFYDTITVEQLRHYAMDANASQDSLNSITQPEITLSYEATGVYVD